MNYRIAEDRKAKAVSSRSESALAAYERDFSGLQWFRSLDTKRAEEKVMTLPSREWIQTYTGRQFFPLNPRVEDIVIEDVAHALSQLCRFGGHTEPLYSVAEHSVRVSLLAERFAHESVRWYVAMWGLLHDATEAYLIDLPRPLKRSAEIGPGYKAAEARLMLAVCKRFDLRPEEPTEVKSADEILLMTERRDLLRQSPELWQEDHDGARDPLPGRIVPWSCADARQEFLTRFFAIKHGRRTECHA